MSRLDFSHVERHYGVTIHVQETEDSFLIKDVTRTTGDKGNGALALKEIKKHARDHGKPVLLTLSNPPKTLGAYFKRQGFITENGIDYHVGKLSAPLSPKYRLFFERSSNTRLKMMLGDTPVATIEISDDKTLLDISYLVSENDVLTLSLEKAVLSLHPTVFNFARLKLLQTRLECDRSILIYNRVGNVALTRTGFSRINPSTLLDIHGNFTLTSGMTFPYGMKCSGDVYIKSYAKDTICRTSMAFLEAKNLFINEASFLMDGTQCSAQSIDILRGAWRGAFPNNVKNLRIHDSKVTLPQALLHLEADFLSVYRSECFVDTGQPAFLARNISATQINIKRMTEGQFYDTKFSAGKIKVDTKTLEESKKDDTFFSLDDVLNLPFSDIKEKLKESVVQLREEYEQHPLLKTPSWVHHTPKI